MSFMQKTAFEQIENHQLEKILDEYQQSRYLFKSIRRAVILIFSLIFSVFILNITVGCILYVLNLSSHIMSHSVSGLVISLYLIAFSLGILYRYTYILSNPLALVNELSAQKIDESTEQLTQQKFSIYDLNQQIAQQFSTSTIDIFVVDEASIQCFNFYLNSTVKQIFVSKGMLHHLSQQELYQVLIAQYILILSGEARERSHYFIYLQGYMTTAYYANRLIFKAKQQLALSPYKLQYLIKLYLGWILKSVSWVDACIYHRVQHYLFHQNFSLDYHIAKYNGHYIDVLQRLQLCPDLLPLQRIDLTYLSPLTLFQANHLWLSSPEKHLQRRLARLGYLSLNIDMLDVQQYITPHQAMSRNIKNVYQQSRFLKQKMLKFDYQKNQLYWHDTVENVEMSKQFNPQNRNLDQIRPLNPEIRAKQAQVYLQQIFPTNSHRLHILSYIFELRKVHKPRFIQTKDISAAVTMQLYKADQRLLLEIFEQCCEALTSPPVAIKPYITAWFKTINSEQKIHLLDALMFERVKAKWQLLGKSTPQNLASVMDSVAKLVQAVCYVQPFYIPEYVYQSAYRETFGQLYPIDLSQTVDYHQVFQDLAGLSITDKLTVLNLIDQLLWYHQKITQDAFDIMVLLYWRLGLNHQELQQMLYKRSQIAIW